MKNLIKIAAATVVAVVLNLSPAFAANKEVCIDKLSGYQNSFRLHAGTTKTDKIKITHQRDGYACGQAKLDPNKAWTNKSKSGQKFTSNYHDGVLYMVPVKVKLVSAMTKKIVKVCVAAETRYRNWFRIHAVEGKGCSECLNTTSGKIFISTAANVKGYLCGLSGKPINPSLHWVHSDPKTDKQYSGQGLRDGVLYIKPNYDAVPDCHIEESAAAVGPRGCNKK